MAAADATAATSSRSGGGGSSADSYIGSFISLTSKSEIRYEGVLYNINTEESSIGLRNVRSFGTEGRKKDGPQVPPSDKIYEYILFRGSDVKDLQVKASPPVQTTPTIDNDPAIIQSNHPHPTIPTSSLPSAPVGLSGTAFQSAQTFYQPGSTSNTKDPSPPNASGSGLGMPTYWHGYYGATNGIPQIAQQSLYQPPPGLSVPPSMQHMQYSGFNSTLPVAGSSMPASNVPDQSSLAPKIANSGLGSYPPASSLSSNIPPQQLVSFTSETMINPLSNKAASAAISTSTPSSSFPSLSHLPPSLADNARLPSVSSTPNAIMGATALPQQTISHPGILAAGASGSTLTDTRTPSLITPGQLLNPGQVTVPGPQSFQTAQNSVEVGQASLETPSETSIPEVKEAQPPILPLPSNSQTQHNADSFNMRNNYRGHGHRGSGVSRPVTNFTEEFDFTAMNEKFKKDEVWGHLGKSNKPQDANDVDYAQNEPDAELPNSGGKSVYNKDDFFDSISCNALDNNPNYRRGRYSEQMKLDTETFGEVSRYRGGYQGGRGGGRFYGNYRGRGYYGGGYGYGGRGRGRGMYNNDW